MAGVAPPGWHDISLPLKQDMHYLTLDPVPPKIYRYHDVELGAKVTITMLEILSHTGTHIDAPRHFIPGGSTVSDMALDATIGYFKDEESILATHRALLSAGVYILEGCALAGVPAGEYELLCLPLLLYKGDAGPCRAILRPLN